MPSTIKITRTTDELSRIPTASTEHQTFPSNKRRKSRLERRVIDQVMPEIDIVGDPMETARIRQVDWGALKQFKAKVGESFEKQRTSEPVDCNVCEICFQKYDPVDSNEKSVHWIQCSERSGPVLIVLVLSPSEHVIRDATNPTADVIMVHFNQIKPAQTPEDAQMRPMPVLPGSVPITEQTGEIPARSGCNNTGCTEAP
ncbi:uncharacterized protein DEA37_0013483 [Paragonimus westermani]|uniref:Uncharacterized protein n=1 Tax=Paragonimus westermani TaxID=34504 RepID=A0A5J4NE79_9TREM|nr:uncharacterized protein DEA37_0013483 [Paragonimus westermani]